ncbi:MAG TPA: hypothetical protein VGL07_16695 [Buttiauxella sp.]|jgi:hypothetical protein
MADERFSKNGKSYALLTFDQITEKGLKELVTALKRNKVNIAGIEADNRARRKDGLQTKIAVLRCEDQQEIAILVGDAGDIIQTKLNGKIIPIQQSEKLNAYAKSLATAIKAEAPRFAKSLARKTKQVVNRVAARPASKTSRERAREGRAVVEQLQTHIDELRKILSTQNEAIATAKNDIDKEKKRLESERAVTVTLTQELANLSGEQQ